MRLGEETNSTMMKAFSRIVLIVAWTAIEVYGQSKESASVRAALLCADGQRLNEQRKYPESEQRFVDGILESEKNANATEIRAGCLVQLSNVQIKLKKYRIAEASARRAIAIFEQFPLGENIGLSTALVALSEALEDEGKYSEAIAAVERAWNLELGNRSDQAAQYSAIPFRRRLGRLYVKSKEYDRATALLQENVSLLEKTGLTGHTEVIPALNDLAAVYTAEGESINAKKLLHRALSLAERWPEEMRTEVLLDTLDLYAQVMRQSGNVAKAKEFADRADAIRERYEEDHRR